EIDTANTTTSQDVQEHLRRGDLSGSSFAFTVDAEEWDDNGPMILRLIRAVTVYDCGPVTFPAYTASTSGNRDTTAGAMPTSTTPANDSLAGRLAAYRVRARLCEIGANA
ncbi:MAG TPA: HK97 family phage prohead protease, partial [Tepidisphaeraceae bacterium]